MLGPRLARRTRLTLLVPAAALVVIAALGVSGAPRDHSTAQVLDPAAVAAPSSSPEGVTPTAPTARTTAAQPERPAQVFGLDVKRLGDVEPAAFDRDDIVVITGWYVPTAITDCPRLAAIYEDGALPHVRGDADALTFCVRSGLLYASRPDLREDRFKERRAIPARFVIGVVAPLGLEIVGGRPTEVVLLGRFVPADGCRTRSGCPGELVVDHVAWVDQAAPQDAF